MDKDITNKKSIIPTALLKRVMRNISINEVNRINDDSITCRIQTTLYNFHDAGITNCYANLQNLTYAIFCNSVSLR